MVSSNWSLLRITELTLALLVVIIATLWATSSAWYPNWPTFGGFPVNPELVVPWLLGIVVFGRAIRHGLSISSAVVSVLCIATILLATLSLQTLYSAPSAGGFAGGMYTLVTGVPLAFIVITQNAVHAITNRKLIGPIRN